MPAPCNLLVQTAAKSVLAQLVDHIKPGSTESSIARIAADLLRQSGYPDTWYYDCPAFVLLGSRSLISVSGRDYQPSNEMVGLDNLVTIDLSPRSGSDWGDCARSFYVEDGVCRLMPLGDEFARGYEAEHSLHALMRRTVSPETTFNELYELARKWGLIYFLKTHQPPFHLKTHVDHDFKATSMQLLDKHPIASAVLLPLISCSNSNY